jgi:L-cysteine/cystine lyase
VLYGARWQPGDELVTCDLEHMAIANAASVIEERFGVKAVRVETPADATTQQMLDLYEQAITPRTRVVALSHIQYSSGLRMPIEEIAQMAHRHGALIVVDGAQTGGHIALDVKALGVDFYAISGQKWVCGPEATGAFWASPDRIRDIDPPFNTHRLADARAESGETAGPPNLLQRFRLASQAPALVAGLTEALGLMQGLGMENVEAHSQALGDRLRSGIGEISACRLTGPAGGPESSGLVSVALEGWQPAQVVDALWERWKIAGRAVRYPGATRFSMAAFNDESDVDAVLEALRVLSKEEAPEPVAGAH